MMDIVLRKRVLAFSYLLALLCGSVQAWSLTHPALLTGRFALVDGQINYAPDPAAVGVSLLIKLLALLWLVSVVLCFVRSPATGLWSLGGAIPVLFFLWWGIRQLAGFAGHCC